MNRFHTEKLFSKKKKQAIEFRLGIRLEDLNDDLDQIFIEFYIDCLKSINFDGKKLNNIHFK